MMEGKDERPQDCPRGRLWRVFGPGLQDIYLLAEDFDKALERARRINEGYNGGQPA